MADILVRDLDRKLLASLKASAKRNGRSLQSEAKSILETAASFSFKEAQAVTRQWRRKLDKRQLADSSQLIRQDRRR